MLLLLTDQQSINHLNSGRLQLVKNEMKKIFALSGSTRTNSTNWKILTLIAEHYKEQVSVEIYNDLGKLPHFDPNLKGECIPKIVQEFFEKIKTANGILICTPEYVFSPPAVLKNALEWTVSETILSFKPTALIVASGVGEKTFESLDLILTSKLLIQGARSKINAEGKFLDDQTFTEIKFVVDSLIRSIESKSL
jgi:chromate reductase, NAD(P)H dehydrogenase (quinone)